MLPEEQVKFNPLIELGSTGLNRWGGTISEEWLTELAGTKAAKVYQEMSDNDPVIGAVLFAIKMLCRQVDWRVDPADESSEARDAAQFLESCRGDMSESWQDVISEALSMLVYGWAFCELVYKRRSGDSTDPTKRSKYDDNRIGWRKIPIRGQTSLLEWVFNDAGELTAMTQSAPPDYKLRTIPVEKALLFRTETTKGNPEGRALDPQTPIPTPDGWRILDDLRPGDKVFDEVGRIRYVTARAEWENRPCFRVRFADGCEIVADAEHQWSTHLLWERSKRRAARVRTTAGIAATVKNSGSVSNHSIPWAEALDYPEQLLPIHPYVLGLWLGDGWSDSGMISSHKDDVEELAGLVAECGYQVGVRDNGARGGNGAAMRVYGSRKWAKDGLESHLTVMGLIMNKHIPEPYLRGSVEQRKALLAGLMDSDGYVDAYGRCEFSNTNKALVQSVAELVRSLGTGVSITLHHRANGQDHILDAWSARFTPCWSPFRLARKAGKILNSHARRQHYIVAADPAEARRTVCIETDAPSHLFLAGTSLIPTHNSLLRNCYRPWYFKKNIEVIEGIGVERDLAGLPIVWVPANVANPTTAAEVLVRDAYKNLATNIRRDEQEGILMPLVYDANGNKTYDLTLLSTGGTRQFATDTVINRYNTQIAATCLADFILLGSQKVGSFALASSKTHLFAVAIGAFLDEIQDVFNTDAIPRLFGLNDFKGKEYPLLQHGDIEDVDLAELGAFISQLALAGAPLFPDETLEKHIRQVAHLPAKGTEG